MTNRTSFYTWFTSYYMFFFLLWVCFYLVQSFSCNKMLRKLFWGVSVAGYFCVLLYLTLLSRIPAAEYMYELKFLWEYSLALAGDASFQKGIVDNMLVFVPLGILFGDACWIFGRRGRWYYALACGVMVSLAIELLQLVTRRGMFEFDDIFNNAIGMMFGYAGCLVFQRSQIFYRKLRGKRECEGC